MPRFVQVVVFAALMLAASGAAADPNQDIARCSLVASNEVRLACYDAAAAALKNIAPAAPAAPSTAAEPSTAQAAPPAATAQVAASAPVALTPPANAKGFRFPTFGLFGSKKEEPAREAATARAPVAEAATTPVPASAAASDSQFGAERLPEPKQADGSVLRPTMRAGITEYSYTPYDRIIVFLDNGQVWRQTNGDTTRLRLRKDRSYTAKIEKGLIGSYNLTVDGIRKMVKVTRIK
jgi:hypothetical protein